MPGAHLHHLEGKCVLPVHGANFPPPRARRLIIRVFFLRLQKAEGSTVGVSFNGGRGERHKKTYSNKRMRRAQECLLEFLV